VPPSNLDRPLRFNLTLAEFRELCLQVREVSLLAILLRNELRATELLTACPTSQIAASEGDLRDIHPDYGILGRLFLKTIGFDSSFSNVPAAVRSSCRKSTF